MHFSLPFSDTYHFHHFTSSSARQSTAQAMQVAISWVRRDPIASAIGNGAVLS